jgi:hypothetical protein
MKNIEEGSDVGNKFKEIEMEDKLIYEEMRDNKKSNAILVEQLRRMEEIHWKLCWS